jgi:K+-sensing histidine kinase KdpD
MPRRWASFCDRLFYKDVFTVNQTAVALTFLLAILAVSTFWGFAVSAFMSVMAVLGVQLFFPAPDQHLCTSPTRRIGWHFLFSWRLP